MRRVHIVGLNPRTGTTLLAECMRLCFDIEKSHEREVSIEHLAACSGVHLTKNPQDIYFLGTRLALDPRFYAICMVRDPRDVVVSAHGGRAKAYWPSTSLVHFREGWAIAKKHVDHPRFIWVKYEDLIASPDRVQEQIASRFPFLTATAKFSEFHLLGSVSDSSNATLNGVRAIDPRNKSKWPEHLGRLRACLERDGPIDRELLELGYATDREWLKKYGIDLARRAPPAASRERQRVLRELRLRATASGLAAAFCAQVRLPIG